MERKMEVGMSQRKLVKSYLNLDALLPHNTPPGGQDLRGKDISFICSYNWRGKDKASN
jgi:hypothetical protein